MKTRSITSISQLLIVLALVWSCGPKDDPQPALPGYLRVPAKLEGYEGSGRVAINGALTLLAEGPEVLDPNTKTYSGVLGYGSSTGLRIFFTDGQPLPFDQTGDVPNEYKSSGTLAIIGTTSPGTYPLNSQAPTPRGEFADLVINLPGPQIYGNTGGSLTITESTLIRTEGSYSLYRVVGSFNASLYASGVGVPQGNPEITGTFDVLLVD